MASRATYQENKSPGHEFALPCAKCSGRTSHKVLVSIDIHGSEGNSQHSFEWYRDHQKVQCLGCKSISYRIADSNSEDYFQVDEDEYEHSVSEKLYPPRLEGIKGLGDESHYLPNKVRQIYDETLTSLAVQTPVLAAIGLRTLLVTVCKENMASGASLF